MIVMRSIDFALRRAEFAAFDTQPSCGDDEFARVVEAAESIGFCQISMRGDEGRVWNRGNTSEGRLSSGGRQATGTVTNVDRVHHRWRIENGMPVYDGTFQHYEDSIYQISSYAALALATYGPYGQDLLELRTAIHEICANVVEHGVRRQHTGEIDIHLKFVKDGIEGSIQDSCKAFDPFKALRSPLPQQVQSRERRGYGLHLIQRLLDSTRYEFNGRGNRITFGKKVRA
jgi:anti-sigma regulatory factor (Ser/Thr protein kinase)